MMHLEEFTAALYFTVILLINGIQSIEVARGDTATIVCDIAGTFQNPRWDDGTSTTIYIAEAQPGFDPSTTDSRWSRSIDTKSLIITSIKDSDAGTYRCSITTSITDSYTTTLTVSNPNAGLDGTCSSTAPIIECSTENAECSATNKCECKTGYEPNAAATECKCIDCCCYKYKTKRDGACGTTLAVCICVMAVLCFLGYKGYYLGASLLLICAVVLCLCAFSGFILNSICLSKECCSGNDECCKVKNCFKADTIAGFSMTGLSVLGTVVVGILICLITGKTADAPNKLPDDKDKQDQEKHRTKPPSGQQGNSAHLGGGNDHIASGR